MANVEKIQGEEILRLLNEVRQDKTLLKMHLLGGEFEHLTVILDIRNRKRTPYLLIDYPEGFRDAIAALDDPRIRFEFTGRDGIRYVFDADGAEYSRGEIWIKLPATIDRYQRRNLFRLEAPPGTRFHFQFNGALYELLGINVSLGGSLGALARLNKTMEKELQIHSPKTLENVELGFPGSDGDSRVNVKQCRIIRREKNPLTQKYEFALEFTEMTEAEEKKFTEIFYKLQRNFLRKRRLMKI
jgi:c-di-GMP-binding flagellar brake protein YcgR